MQVLSRLRRLAIVDYSADCVFNPAFYYILFISMSVLSFYCQRGNRAKKRGCLGGRIITPRNVGKSSQILRNPLKFAFLTTFGCKEDPIFG